MKVLYVNNAQLCSGAEEHLLDIAGWMLSQGHQCVFVTGEESILATKVEQTGWNVPVYRCFSRSSRLKAVFALADAILAEQPDVVSINRDHTLYAVHAACLLARLRGGRRLRTAVIFHTPTGRSYPLLSLTDGIAGTSRYTAASFAESNPSVRARMEVLHYGVTLPEARLDEKQLEDRPRRFFTDRKGPVIAMVGELWKNQEELIKAGPELIRRVPGLTVAIVGGAGGIDTKLSEMIRAHGLEASYILTGRIPRERIHDMFRDLEFSVSTHRNEGFGIVHIESLAVGSPVVAYNSGGLVEILEKGGGVLVDGDRDAFVAAVVDLLEHREKRHALAIEGRRNVEENFSLEAMGQRHLAFYNRILGRA